MDEFYQRREKFPEVPELTPFSISPDSLLGEEDIHEGLPNIQIYYREQDRSGVYPTDEKFARFHQLSQELGYSLLLPQYFAYGVAKLVQEEIVDIDELRVVPGTKKEVAMQFSDLRNKLNQEMNIDFEDQNPVLTLSRKVGRVSLLDEIKENKGFQNVSELVSGLQLVIQFSNEHSRAIQQDEENILAVITHSPLARNSLTIDVSDCMGSQVSRAYNDASLNLNDLNPANVKALTKQFTEKLKKRKAAAASSEFMLTNTLTANNMPHHPVFRAVKSQLEPHISSLEADTLFDPMDLLYQVSFRLTCFKLGDIFVDYKDEHFEPDQTSIEQMTALQDYNFIRQFTGTKWGEHQVNGELIDKLVSEQLLMAKDRYRNSKTNADTVLGRKEPLDKDGWFLVNQKGRVFAMRDNGDGLLEVRFEEIDSELASDYHATYHYIHAPRAKRSFGLFLEGAEVPFTIAAIDDIDRDYKKEALLILGYDYENCIDFTRLYSVPGVPKFASSTISRLIKEHLLIEKPNMQAAISTFMPTYANSNSMFACGFDKPFLLKRNTHKFAERPDIGEGAYEHLTNRRAEGKEVISNRQVLLPVVELLSEIKKPRFKPYIDISKSMMVRSGTK